MQKTTLALAIVLAATFGLATVADAQTKRIEKESDQQRSSTRKTTRSSSRHSTTSPRSATTQRSSTTHRTSTRKYTSTPTSSRTGSVRYATTPRRSNTTVVTSPKVSSGSRVIVQNRRGHVTQLPSRSTRVVRVPPPQARCGTCTIRRAPRPS